MEQIELVLENAGVRKRAIFPCTESEYRAICKELLLKDNYAFVREAIMPKAFGFKEDTFVNLDETNGRIRRKRNEMFSCGGRNGEISLDERFNQSHVQSE